MENSLNSPVYAKHRRLAKSRYFFAYEKKYIVFVVLFYLFIFQGVLENTISIFGYADEIVAVLAVPFFLVSLVQNHFTIKKEKYNYTIFLLLFIVFGFLGNLIYEYQSLNYVILDLFLCLKFWLAIYVGSYLFKGFSLKNNARGIYFHCKVITILFLILCIADNFLELFDTTIRYGLRSTQLFYSHPTYFAAACVFIIAVLTSIKKYISGGNIYLALLFILLISTLRMKAIAAVVAFIFIFYIVLKRKKKINLGIILLLCIFVVLVAWEQIYYYFFSDIQDSSARYNLLITSFLVANDHFPFGSGFGTYASYYSGVNYSPLYSMYGISNIWGLVEGSASFVSDSFWPMILGQTGWLGLIMYVIALFMLFMRIQKLKDKSAYKYASALCILCYLLISSTSESAFVNSMSIPLAVWLGVLFEAKE